MTMPNFLALGSMRCASTSLYAYLSQHPQIYMSPMKEPYYFFHYGGAIPFNGPGDYEANLPCYVPNLAAYEAQFSGVRDELAIGEASASYLYGQEVPARIKRDIPHAKLFAMLRNPVDRAYSAYGLLRIQHREPAGSFSEALDLEEERIAKSWEPMWHYKSMGMYAGQVRRYLEAFDREQLRFYLYDDFDRDPQAVMRDIFAFLGVDDAFVPDMSTRLNSSYVPQHRQMYSALTGTSLLRPFLRSVIPWHVRERLKMRVVNSVAGEAGLAPEVRRQLVEVFRNDIVELQERLGRDLSNWLQPERAPAAVSR